MFVVRAVCVRSVSLFFRFICALFSHLNRCTFVHYSHDSSLLFCFAHIFFLLRPSSSMQAYFDVLFVHRTHSLTSAAVAATTANGMLEYVFQFILFAPAARVFRRMHECVHFFPIPTVDLLFVSVFRNFFPLPLLLLLLLMMTMMMIILWAVRLLWEK